MKQIKYTFAVMTALFLLNAVAFPQSRYVQFGNINHGSVNVTSAWTKLDTTAGTHSFTKTKDATVIEVYVNSRFSVGTISGAHGVQFQVRVDHHTPNFDNFGSLLKSNSSESLSLIAVFEHLPAGNHTVSIWGQAPSGSAAGVTVDPGGWGGKIIVKETD